MPKPEDKNSLNPEKEKEKGADTQIGKQADPSAGAEETKINIRKAEESEKKPEDENVVKDQSDLEDAKKRLDEIFGGENVTETTPEAPETKGGKEQAEKIPEPSEEELMKAGWRKLGDNELFLEDENETLYRGNDIWIKEKETFKPEQKLESETKIEPVKPTEKELENTEKETEEGAEKDVELPEVKPAEIYDDVLFGGELATGSNKEEAVEDLAELQEQLKIEKNKETRKAIERKAETLFEVVTEKDFKEEVKKTAKENAEKRGYTVWKVEDFKHSTEYQNRLENFQKRIAKEQKDKALNILWKNMSEKEKKPEYVEGGGKEGRATRDFFEMVNEKIHKSGLSPDVFYDLLNKGYRPDQVEKTGFIGRFFGEPAFKIWDLKGNGYFAFKNLDQLEKYDSSSKSNLVELRKNRAIKMIDSQIKEGRSIMSREKRASMIDIIRETVKNYRDQQAVKEEKPEIISVPDEQETVEKPKRGRPKKEAVKEKVEPKPEPKPEPEDKPKKKKRFGKGSSGIDNE